MPIDFPNSPTNGQTFTSGDKTWEFDGTSWVLVTSTASIGTGAIATANIADNAITTAKIAAGAVVEADIATDAVTTNKIANNAVTAAKLATTAAIQPTIVDAKGDLIVGTGADTVARQGVGANGSVLMADSAQTNGIAWSTQSLGYRNVIINGGFDVWQRGTSSTVTGNTYLADRWVRASQAGSTQERSTDVPTGEGFRYSWKHTASATNTFMQFGQQVEFVNCKQLQNKTVQISFWAKAINSNGGSTGLTVRTRTNSTVDALTYFSGSASDTSVTLTTSWAKYTVSRTLPSTFGALSLEFVLGTHVSGDGFFLTGVQMELGSVATPFEFEDYGTTLAKCQRYYYRMTSNFGSNYTSFGFISANGTTSGFVMINPPVTLRSDPSAVEFSTLRVWRGTGTDAAVTSMGISTFFKSAQHPMLEIGVASGLVNDNFYVLGSNNSASGYLAITAEL